MHNSILTQFYEYSRFVDTAHASADNLATNVGAQSAVVLPISPPISLDASVDSFSSSEVSSDKMGDVSSVGQDGNSAPLAGNEARIENDDL